MDVEGKGYCEVCDVTLTSKEHASSHYDGRKHKKKMADTLQSAHTNNRLSPNYCPYCKISVSGPAPMRQHKESAKHIKKVQDASQRSRHGSDADRSTASSSPSGSTYNDFDIKPDATSTDGINRHDMEERQENNYDGNQYPAIPGGPSTLMSHPPKDKAASSLQSHIQPSSMNTVIRKQNEALPHNLKISSLEIAARLNAMAIADTRTRLVAMCKRRIQQRMDQIIPQMAEAIVDEMLVALQDPGAQSAPMAHMTNPSRPPPGLENQTQVTSSMEPSQYQLFSSEPYQTAPVSLSNGQPQPYQTAPVSLSNGQSFAGSSSSFYSAATSFAPGLNINGTD